MPARAEGYPSYTEPRQVPVNSFRWFSQPGSIPRGGRRVFSSVWKFLNPCANEPSGSPAQCQAPVVDPKPYDRWGIEDERHAMLQADTKPSPATPPHLFSDSLEESASQTPTPERRERSESPETRHVRAFRAAIPCSECGLDWRDYREFEGPGGERRWGRRTPFSKQFTAGELMAIRRRIEGENMEQEDNDVRFDHFDSRAWRRFPEGACWLCRRPFSDSSDDEQTADMLGRARTGPWRRRPYWDGHQKPACQCTLCSDCWLSKASDNKCPPCRANITRWRVRDFFCRPDRGFFAGFLRQRKRRRVHDHAAT